MEISRSILVVASLLALSCVSVSAQQVTGVPGSPEATTTIPGKQLPPPDPAFEGGRFGGYGLFLSKGDFGVGRGRVVFLYNLLDLKRTMWEGPELGAGKHTIVFDFKSDAPGLGKGGVGVLSVDGKEVARNTLEHTTPILFPEDETFDVGQDTRTGVALVEYRYDVPFKFTGKIDKLTFKLKPFTKEEAKAMP
jgi:hypothetical protein